MIETNSFLDPDNPQAEFPDTFKLLPMLYRLSRTIADDTNLNNLFSVTHEQISQMVGEVNVLIARYDPEQELIDFPYAFENGNIIQVPPVPIGQGLTSIILRTGKPILLSGNVAQEAKTLGAVISGPPAKSWLGVPIRAGEESIGAIIIQDLERENRFSPEDQNFLNILASQTAIAIRNSVLLEESRKRAEIEKLLGDASARIRETLDIEIILKTAALEMRKLIDLNEVEIRLGNPEKSGIDQHAQPHIQI